MKKALLCGLSAALLLALVLVACNKPQADQPDPAPTPSAVQTEPAETNEPVNQVEQMSVSTQQEVDPRREATLMDLLDLFQTVYDCRADWISLGETEEVLELLELEEVNVQVAINPDVMYPADIQNQYLTWKAIYYGTTEPVPAEEQQQATDMAENSTTTQIDAPASNPQQQLFTECNQTMYATGTVNIRASYSTKSDKLGTLYRGMSVTCIGIGQGEAEGWNMVILESGTTAYMVGSYLSTQKPEMNIVTGGGGGTSTTQNNTGTGGTGGTGGPGGTGGGLAVDVTGGKSPMDFYNAGSELQEEINNSGAFLDMSKVGFGN